MSRIKVKICCISSVEEAQLAIAYGATAIGLVGPMPSGPGIISNALIFEINKAIPKSIETFLLTSETHASAIIRHHQKVLTSTIQLVDTVPLSTYTELRKQLPDIKIVQVIHVMDNSAIKKAQAIAPYVDTVLLDSGHPNLKIKELGGTGRTHNWSISRAICESIETPVYLAGGIRPSNVKEAIRQVQPTGIDLCSGVRTNGHLDPKKLQAFFDEL